MQPPVSEGAQLTGAWGSFSPASGNATERLLLLNVSLLPRDDVPPPALSALVGTLQQRPLTANMSSMNASSTMNITNGTTMDNATEAANTTAVVESESVFVVSNGSLPAVSVLRLVAGAAARGTRGIYTAEREGGWVPPSPAHQPTPSLLSVCACVGAQAPSLWGSATAAAALCPGTRAGRRCRRR